jgi:hypothetical protein
VQVQDEPAAGYGYLEEHENKRGRPLVATLVGAAALLLLVAVPIGPPGEAPLNPDEAMAYRAGELFGAAVLSAGIVWGIAYAITLRFASRKWKIASLIVLGIVATIVSVARIGAREGALRDDTSDAIAELDRATRGSGTLDRPLRAGDGPLTAMLAALANPALADRQAFDREAEAAQVQQVLDLELPRSAPVLRNCERIAALEPRATALRGRLPAYLQAGREAAEPFVRRGALSAGQRDEFLAGAGAPENRNRFERQWTLTAGWARESAALCRILADRPWRRTGGLVTFDTERDHLAAQRHIDRVNTIAEEMQRIESDRRSRARRDLEGLRR